MTGKFKTSFLLLFASIALQSGPASADYIPPDLVEVHTERYHPAKTDFAAGTYTYGISWEGIPVARASVTVRPSGGGAAHPVGATTLSENPSPAQPISQTAPATPEPDLLRVTAAVQTGRFIDLLYRLRHSSESIFDSRTLQPVTFFSHQTENSKTKLRKVEFSKDGNVSARLWKLDKKGNEIPEESRQFHTDNAMFDPITAAFFARSLPVGSGESRDFDVFNGKHRFLITMKVGEHETIKVKGKKYDTFAVTPSVKKLTDTEGETRLTSAKIWITADDRRDVVRLESAVFVGSVTADLEAFTPWRDPNANLVRASMGTVPPGAAGNDPRGAAGTDPTAAANPAPQAGPADPGSPDTRKGLSDTKEAPQAAEKARSEQASN